MLDPVLVYSTYLGGTGEDYLGDIAADASGNAYITGLTSSVDFPTADALQPVPGGSIDAFVAKLNTAGSALVYSTYLGGINVDTGYGIAVDSFGNAFVTGGTGSPDFPTVNPLQPEKGVGSDAFVAKLNAAGSMLIYSTYLGGNGQESGYDVAVDVSGSAILVGETLSTDFPTANPLQSAKAGSYDAFVSKLNAVGSALILSTYLGGSDYDAGWGSAVDAVGNIYVTGFTYSWDFPTANPLQSANAGPRDAFVTKLNAAGTALVYSTYLGGSGSDWAQGIVPDALGRACISGATQSTNFPTRNALQPTNGGDWDAFVTKLNANGMSLAYSTYLGGSGADNGYGIEVDAAGRLYVVGWTQSTNFPTRTPFQAANAGAADAFVTKFAESSVGWPALEYSSYLGGNRSDVGIGIAVDASGNAYVIGSTESTDFPLVGPIQDTNHGRGDLFVSKIGAGEISGMPPQDH